MNQVLAIDFKGHLVELRDTFDTKLDILKYLHNHHESFKDLKLFIIDYEDDKAVYGTEYKYDLITYHSCESGVYSEDHYNEYDEGKGVIEIGSSYYVNNDLLPQDLKDDGELIEIAIEKWINLHFSDSNPPKPIWLI